MPAFVVPDVATIPITLSGFGSFAIASSRLALVKRWSSVVTMSGSTPSTCSALPTLEWASEEMA